jgi:hypothetical protein
MYRGGYVIILSCKKCCHGELALLLLILTVIDFALLCTEKHDIYVYCEQMHCISEHCAYSVWQCICKFMFNRCMILFRQQERGCFQNVCCKCIHHLQCTFFSPLIFYSQTATEARQICRLLIASKNRPLSRIVYCEGIVYFHMFLSSHSLGNAKMTQFILLSRYINPLNAELNPISHLLALLGVHHILHISM